MPTIMFDEKFINFSAGLGFTVDIKGRKYFRDCDNVVFEPPVHLASTEFQNRSLKIGAFSYAVSGFLLGAVVGRYVSIAADIQIGLTTHPTDHLTTHPIPWTEMPVFENYLRQHKPEIRRDIQPVSFEYYKTTIIGNDVWIGTSVYIKDGITIGDGAIIGAHSVVTQNVPPYAIVSGVPAKIMRMRFSDRIIEQLLALKWWEYLIYDFRGVDLTRPEEAISKIKELKDAGDIVPYSPGEFDLINLYSSYTRASIGLSAMPIDSGRSDV